jgi:hypothetical protein
MKTAQIATIFGLMLAATPALAAIDPGHSFSPKPKSAPQEVADLLVVDNQQNVLPLECRGYYVRNIRKPAALSRCE